MSRLINPLLRRFRTFADDRAANVAVIAAIVIPTLIIAGGMAIDLGRLNTARSHAQDVVDAAALQGAASGSTDVNTLRAQAQNYIDASLNAGLVRRTSAVRVNIRNGRVVDVSFDGQTPAMFVSFFGVRQMDVTVDASTERAVDDQLEISLVLDNTWSMSDVDGRGVQKIVALRQAAENLVNTVSRAANGRARFALVPYADYVNVGVNNRSAAWLTVPADYSVTSTPSPQVCTTRTTRGVCTGGVQGTCYRTVDGVRESYSCWTTPQTCTTQTVAPYQSCSGGGQPVTTWYRWYGCVGSRTVGNLRLDDSQPAVRYPGYLATSQNCLNPIVPLTNNTSTVVNAIRSLVVNIGGYKPNTYIPAGMIWGVNTLSPTAPFTEGAAYDTARNRQPRKVLVLMTDGENTLQFRSSDGRHIAPENGQSDSDTVAICRYAQRQGIEIYSVALAVNSNAGRDILRQCASQPENYFDAQDTQQLADAFASIAASINTVRLVR